LKQNTNQPATDQPATNQTVGAGGRTTVRVPAPERRELILGAALDAFADDGYHETSLDQVARRAGVSKALIYEHFRSKGDLYGELLETYVHELLDRVRSAALSVEEGPELKLIAGVEGFLEFVDERRDAWRMLIRNRASDDVADLFERLHEEVAGVIAALMAEDMPSSALPEAVDSERAVEATAVQLLGGLTAIANWWDGHRDVERETVLAMVMEFAWVGLQRASSGERWTLADIAGEDTEGAQASSR
jgi:AcrR family transcriptional regulator